MAEDEGGGGDEDLSTVDPARLWELAEQSSSAGAMLELGYRLYGGTKGLPQVLRPPTPFRPLVR